MPLSPEDIRLIEDKIQGQLSDLQEAQFQSRVKDPSFQEEFEFQQSLQRAQSVKSREEWRQRFDSWDQDGPRMSNRNWTKIIGIVGLIILVFLTVYWLGSKETPPDHEELFYAYYQDFPNLIDPIQKGEETSSLSISQWYESKQYSKAILIEPVDSLEAFYLGLSLLANDEIDRSIPIIESIVNDTNHRFHSHAQWFMALCFLKRNDVDRCLKVLQDITQDNSHDFHSSAQELLNQLSP